VALAFSLILGAWPILPFAGIEMIGLYAAFRHIDRHAGDYERITIKGTSIEIEVKDGTRLSRIELERYWARVLYESGGNVVLRSRGHEVELGRHLPRRQLAELARELRRALGNWGPGPRPTSRTD
jgi:uncharacterized membrane protein